MKLFLGSECRNHYHREAHKYLWAPKSNAL